MKNEVLEAFEPVFGCNEGLVDGKRVFVDGTVGGGGHAEAILRSDPGSFVLGIDRDEVAVEVCRERLGEEFEGRFIAEQGSYAKIPEILERVGLPGRVHGVLVDLGVSSPQVDDGERGFSFIRDGPLDMRFSQQSRLPEPGVLGDRELLGVGSRVSAGDLVNFLSEADLTALFRELGEEPRASACARAIVAARATGLKFERTLELAAVLERALGRGRRGKRHPATRCFQALRMAVNDEMGHVEELGRLLPDILAFSVGRFVGISFHALEARRLDYYTKYSRHLEPVTGFAPKHVSNEEAEANPRSRSAMLFAAQRLEESSSRVIVFPSTHNPKSRRQGKAGARSEFAMLNQIASSIHTASSSAAQYSRNPHPHTPPPQTLVSAESRNPVQIHIGQGGPHSRRANTAKQLFHATQIWPKSSYATPQELLLESGHLSNSPIPNPDSPKTPIKQSPPSIPLRKKLQNPDKIHEIFSLLHR